MPPVVKILGYAGLIPFIGLALLSIMVINNELLVHALALYSFGIFTFLCGAWWPTADMQQAKFWRIILSNVLFLTAFFTFLLLPNQWLAIAAFLFIFIWVIERFGSLVPEMSNAYIKMRTVLSFVASVSLLTAYAFGVA
jgi:hypothetical protein